MTPRISVVVPTYNRREHVRRCLESLERQTLAREAYEVIVVVDGASDGTAEFLATFRPSYALRVLSQENAGLSAARNHGNAHARAAVVLCLDDDMVASPALLAEHLAAHAGGERLLVQGGLSLHESVARTPFLRYEESLRQAFARDKSRPGASLDGEDVSGGNISIAKSLLDEVGGFNASLKGLRNTDGELAYRLSRCAVRIVYCHAAMAAMTHSNDFAASVRASYLYGKSYVYSQAQYPETRWKLSPLLNDRGWSLRRILRWFYVRPEPEWRGAAIEAALVAITRGVELLHLTPLLPALYRAALDVAFWRGVHEASGGKLREQIPRGVPILCYHEVSDEWRFSFRHYILPRQTFKEQVAWLVENGYTAISLDALHDYLERGTPLPERPVVITFDDGYRNLCATATPVLAASGFRHTHFLTTGRLGRTTDWVTRAPDLELMRPDDVRELQGAYGDLVDFQAHGHNHASMENIDEDLARSEVLQSIATIEGLTKRPVRYFAHPYGDYDERTPAIMRELPIKNSFTVDRGLARPGQDAHLVARVEVFATDLYFDFPFKVRCGWSPLASLRARAGDVEWKLRALLGRPRRRVASWLRSGGGAA